MRALHGYNLIRMNELFWTQITSLVHNASCQETSCDQTDSVPGPLALGKHWFIKVKLSETQRSTKISSINSQLCLQTPGRITTSSLTYSLISYTNLAPIQLGDKNSEADVEKCKRRKRCRTSSDVELYQTKWTGYGHRSVQSESTDTRNLLLILITHRAGE